MNNKKLLVVGDVMIDRSWLVRPVEGGTTSQAHAGVEPRKVINPGPENDSLGGAATVARSLLVLTNLPVTLAGCWSDEVEFLLKEKRTKLIPELTEEKVFNRFELLRIARSEFDTIKMRIYSSSKGKIIYESRLDQDLQSGHHKSLSQTLPSKDEVAAVVVADFAKGIVDLQDIQDELKKYDDQPFLLRAKRSAESAVIKKLPWTVLLPNRQDLRKLSGKKGNGIRRAMLIVDGKEVLFNPEFVSHLKEAEKLIGKKHLDNDNRAIFVKLDREGGVLFKRSKLLPFALIERSSDARGGIGAGDHFMASLACELASGKPLEDACENSVKLATLFCAITSKIVDDPNLESRRTIPNTADTELTKPIVIRGGESNIKILLKTHEKERLACEVIKGPTIRIASSQWFLKSFITVETDVGQKINSLLSQIENYRDFRFKSARPFVGAICGSPGAGKSTFTRAIANEFNCHFIETNAAQWASQDELFDICEQVRTASLENRFPLVFLDEVDSMLEGQTLYGKLLAPLWDGCYMHRSEPRSLGRVIFLVAGSDEYWRTEKALRDVAEKEDTNDTKGDKLPYKLRDLVTRLSCPPIEITELSKRPADALYITAYQILNLFPTVRSISQDVLRLLAHSARHGSRSIVQVLELSGPLKDDIQFKVEDLPDKHLLELHLSKPVQITKEEKMIKVQF